MVRGSILFIYIAWFICFALGSAPVGTKFLKPRSVSVHVKVGIRNVALAMNSLTFPNLIPLLHGNSIVNYEKQQNGFYVLFPTPSIKTYIFPMRSKAQVRNVAGFVFKESTLGAHPVPMENAMVFLSLVPKTPKSAWLHFWIVSYGIYTPFQLSNQKLYTRSLVREFADNARRVLGVSHCRHYISVSGLCNHLQNTQSGTTMHVLWSPITRSRPTSKTLAGMQPNVRFVSDIIVKTKHNKPAPFQVNMFFVVFGQFLDHDIILTPNERVDAEASVPIHESKSGLSMQFTRSAVLRYKYSACCHRLYVNSKRVWQGLPFNRLTSFIDASAVYGSNHLRVQTLRSFKDGKLVLKNMGREAFLPFNNPYHLKFTLHNEPSDHDQVLFVAGDARSNENIFLTAIHTLFAREHNRICDLLLKWLRARGNEKLLRDNWLFATARKIVAAELQSITFNEFVPLLLGPNALSPYHGYNSRVDARISVFHSTVAYRWGHSSIAEKFHLRDRHNKPRTKKLRDLFFNTKEFFMIGMDNLVVGAMNTSAMDVDEQIVDSLRDSLFMPPEKEKLDLASINLQRGRDLGLPGYMEMQALFRSGQGMNNIRQSLRDKLMHIYRDANKIDAWIGCLSESKKPGALLGPLCWKINQEQFTRLRDGDRFYYENVRWHSAIRDMPLIRHIMNHKYRMADLVLANTRLNPALFRKNVSLFKTDSFV